MTPEEIMQFFLDNHLHIGDGVDDCAGEDYDAMREAAARLSEQVRASIEFQRGR